MAAVVVISVAVAILVGVVISPRLGAPEWALGAAGLGAAKIGMDAIGTEGLGTAKIGMDAIGAVATGMATIGTTGMAIGIIIITTMLFLSVVSAFPDGGAGDGVLPGDGGTHMDIMDTGTRTDMATAIHMGMKATDTVITGTVTAMDMVTAITANTALLLIRK